MNWNKLTDISNINTIISESNSKRMLVFKHSTRCSISSSVLNRIERNWQESDTEKMKPYFLDILSHRDISNQVAEIFQVEHESPQILVIENGNCIYSETHSNIRYEDLIQVG